MKRARTMSKMKRPRNMSRTESETALTANTETVSTAGPETVSTAGSVRMSLPTSMTRSGLSSDGYIITAIYNFVSYLLTIL
jgi:hypothetical protein